MNEASHRFGSMKARSKWRPTSEQGFSCLLLSVDQYFDNAVTHPTRPPKFGLTNCMMSPFNDSGIKAYRCNNCQRHLGKPPSPGYSYPGICAIATKSPNRGPVTPKTLQHLRRIGHETAARTIGKTTQYAMRHAKHPTPPTAVPN
jgi:hypothetical protein